MSVGMIFGQGELPHPKVNNYGAGVLNPCKNLNNSVIAC